MVLIVICECFIDVVWNNFENFLFEGFKIFYILSKGFFLIVMKEYLKGEIIFKEILIVKFIDIDFINEICGYCIRELFGCFVCVLCININEELYGNF